MRYAFTLMMFLTLPSVLAQQGRAQSSPQFLVVDPDITFTTVTTDVTFDGGNGLYTYTYSIASPSSNDGMIGQIILPIGASKPADFPATPPPSGLQQDAYGVLGMPANGLLPIATVGSPPGFNAWRGGNGEIGWDLTIVGTFVDGGPRLSSPIPPGATVSGFVVRSRFPPGPRTMRLLPIVDVGHPAGTIPVDLLEVRRTVEGPVDVVPCTTPQCRVDVVCPPTFAWRNHGDYVSCVSHEANRLEHVGTISPPEHGDLVKTASNSNIGKPQ